MNKAEKKFIRDLMEKIMAEEIQLDKKWVDDDTFIPADPQHSPERYGMAENIYFKLLV